MWAAIVKSSAMHDPVFVNTERVAERLCQAVSALEKMRAEAHSESVGFERSTLCDRILDGQLMVRNAGRGMVVLAAVLGALQKTLPPIKTSSTSGKLTLVGRVASNVLDTEKYRGRD